jgi:hypothetical protein
MGTPNAIAIEVNMTRAMIHRPLLERDDKGQEGQAERFSRRKYPCNRLSLAAAAHLHRVVENTIPTELVTPRTIRPSFEPLWIWSRAARVFKMGEKPRPAFTARTLDLQGFLFQSLTADPRTKRKSLRARLDLNRPSNGNSARTLKSLKENVRWSIGIGAYCANALTSVAGVLWQSNGMIAHLPELCQPISFAEGET